MNYLVGDFIIRIKNASLAHRKDVVMPYANIAQEIGNVLVKEGFLASIKTDENEGRKTLNVEIRYDNRKPVINQVTIVSKPSLRVYLSIKEIAYKTTREAVTSILSTNMGIMTGKEALKKKVGGELLFKIW